MKNITLFTILSLLIGLTIISCKKDDDMSDDPNCDSTWDKDVSAIIQATCAYAGCHSGGIAANPYIPASSNDFTSYASIKSTLDNGSFKTRALVDKNMPNSNFVPDGKPKSLTDAQLDILNCWADEGFPEK